MSLPAESRHFFVASSDDLPSVKRYEDLTPGVWKKKGNEHFYLLVSKKNPCYISGYWSGVTEVHHWSEGLIVFPVLVEFMPVNVEYVRISMKVTLDFTPNEQ